MNKKVLAASSLVLGTLLLIGAGCDTTSTNSTNTTNTTKTNTTTTNKNTANTNAAVTTPTVSIVSPVEGATVASKMPLEVKITGLTLAPNEVEKANVAGRGHYHVWVDGEYFTPGTATSMTVVDANGEGLAVGEHTIMVSLQNNDHTDLAPAVKSTAVKVTVK